MTPYRVRIVWPNVLLITWVMAWAVAANTLGMWAFLPVAVGLLFAVAAMAWKVAGEKVTDD